MASYSLQISKTAEKSLKKIPKKVLSKLVQTIRYLVHDPWPLGCKKLAGEENTYRIRVGIYRVIYEIRQKELVILVLKIGHRKDAYR